MSEIVRAGIISVDEGQAEAAQSLGMTRLQTMRRIVLPQAMRVIIPPTGNETISMLKTTSLASVVGRHRARSRRRTNISNANYEVIPLLIVASLWYLAMTSRALRRPVLPRAPLRARLLARAAADAAAAAAARRVLASATTRSRSARSVELAPRRERPMTVEPMVRAEGVHKRFGRLEVLRGISLEVAPRRGDVHHRAVGLGQVDVPAHDQPPREDQQRPAVGRRRARRLPRARRQAARAARQRGRQAPHRDRDGLPALQPVPAQDRARERDRGAAARARRAEGAGGRARRPRCSSASGSPTSSRAIRRSSRAASSSASRSRGRWR